MTLTAEQLASRHLSIGSSDVPAILGLDPHRSPFQVWLAKVHPEENGQKEEPQMALGHRLEPFVASWCSEIYEPLTQHGRTLSHPHCPWLSCTPDYVNNVGEPWEIKAWGMALTEDCPEFFEVQVAVQMACMEAATGHVGAWNRRDTEPPRHYQVTRDATFERDLIDVVRAFWHDHVLPKREPPPDASDAYGRYLSLATKPTRPGFEAKPEDQISVTASAYRAGSLEINRLEAENAARLNQMKDMMREVEWVKTPAGTLYYRGTDAKGQPYKPRVQVDWKAVAHRFMDLMFDSNDSRISRGRYAEMCEQIIADHRTEKPVGRLFKPVWKDD
jgi:putative phage-type endonuclease